jgi:hypothetical protein
MKKLKIKFYDKKNMCILKKNTRFYMEPKQIIKYFLSPNFEYEFVNDDYDDSNVDIFILGINSDKISDFHNDKINILLSIENAPYWNLYKHYKKFKDYGNKSIDIYLYNHISNLIKPYENSLSIPTVYSRINYFKQYEQFYKNHNQLQCQFLKKKFGLKPKKSNIGKELIIKFCWFLKGKKYNLDDISYYPSLNTKSCYNSIEFLEVLNKYKFITCFENSSSNGYITEKIFNCFFAKTIPIYYGAPDIENFINKDSFIRIQSVNDFEKAYELIKELNENEDKYNEFINRTKISNDFNNENYIEEFDNIIKKKLNL